MDRDLLVDLTHRALKLARDKTTDLAPAEYTVKADTYTSAERHDRDMAMLLDQPATRRLCVRIAEARAPTARRP